MCSRHRASLLKLFFALLFVCAQQQAVLHTLGHGIERIEQKQDDPGGIDESFCAKCLAIAHLDHAVGTPSFDLAPVRFAPPRASGSPHESATPTPVRRYQSRAPPTFS